jgi:hypothetical protein
MSEAGSVERRHGIEQAALAIVEYVVVGEVDEAAVAGGQNPDGRRIRPEVKELPVALPAPAARGDRPF